MSNRRYSSQPMYSSACVQALEQQYCSSCSAAVVSSACVVSSQGFGARLVSRVYNGGRQVVYTATVGAMLANNFATPAYGWISTVSAGQTVSGFVISAGTSDTKNYLQVYGSTLSTVVNDYTYEWVKDGGTTSGTLITANGGGQVLEGAIATGTIIQKGTQWISANGLANDTVIYNGTQTLYYGGATSGTTIKGGYQGISSGGVALDTLISHGRQSVYLGGEAVNTVILSGAGQVISNGGIAYSTVLSSGGMQWILSGGVASNTLVNEGAIQDIASGGTAWYTSLYNSANQHVSAGGSAIGNILLQATQYVSSGAYVSGGTLSAGGSQIVWGTTSDMQILSGGEQTLSSGGLATGTTLNANGRQIISSGGVANSTTVNSGGSQVILSGGVASNTSAQGLGVQYISSGGLAVDTLLVGIGNGVPAQVVSAGGTARNTIVGGQGNSGRADQRIYGAAYNTDVYGSSLQLVYGLAEDTVLHDSGSLQRVVSSVAVASNTTVHSGAKQEIWSGGTAISTAVMSGGAQVISSGGVASHTLLNEGGYQEIQSGGLAYYTSLYNSANQHVSAGGSAISNVLLSGSIQYVSSGAYVSGGTLSAGGSQVVWGTTSDMQILSGGEQTLSSGGKDYTAQISSGGKQIISNGGTAAGTTVNFGGVQEIFSGGVANSTVVNSDGRQIISNGAVANGAIVNDYGYQEICGGVANNTTVNSRGEQYVWSGGVANNTTVNSRAFQYVESGGVANDTTVNSNGFQYVESGGVTSNTMVNSGNQYVSAGASAYNTVINNDGYQAVSGYASGTVVNSGVDRNMRVFSGGIAEDVTVNSGGEYAVFSGGTGNGAVVNAGGTQSVYGVANSTTVNSGGYQTIKIGGVANSTTLLAGGSQIISSGGVASHTLLNEGGYQEIQSGGTAWYTSLYNSANQHVSAGGSAISNVLLSGSIQYVSSGAYVSGGTLSAGGSQVVWGTTSDMQILGGGEQTLSSGGKDYNATISGGTQIISNGGHVYNAVVLYADATETMGEQFILSGGMAESTTLNQGAGQLISSGGRAIDAIVNGGAQVVSSAGQASGTVINDGYQHVLAGGMAYQTTINAGTTTPPPRQVIDPMGSASYTTVNGGLQVISGSAQFTTLHNGKVNVHSGGTLNNVTVSGGILNISGGVASKITQYGGTTELRQGSADDFVLSAGGILVNSAAHMNDLTATGGTLNISGTNALSGTTSLANAQVNLIRTDGANTLTIPTLSANNAVFNMNVDLVNQTADTLSITSSYSGNSLLSLNNVAASANATSDNGIKLVDFSNTATVNGTFALLGGEWNQGAYTYNLFQGTGADKDYYLRSTGQYTPVYETMLNIPAVNAQLARAGMNSLQKRLGDLQDMDNLMKKHGVWARGYYKDMSVKERTKTDVDLAGLEAGYDWLLLPDAPTRIYVGVMGGYMDVNSVKTTHQQNSYSKGDGYAPSVGLYAALVNADRWFLDWTVRDFWTTLKMKQYTSSRILEYTPKRNVLATSLEGGKGFVIPLERGSWLTLTPKLELSYMYAFASHTGVKNGLTDLTYKDTPYLSGKLSLQAGYKTYWLDNLLLEPFMELGYGYEWKGRSRTTYDGVTEVSSAKGGMWEADLGLNMQLSRSLYVYMLGSYERGPKLSAYGLHGGIRYMFGKHPSWQAQQTAVRAAQARANGFASGMNRQNGTTSYVDAPAWDQSGQAYQRPVHTEQYVYPQRPAPAGVRAPVVYPIQDEDVYRQMSSQEAAVQSQAATQAELNRQEATAQLQAREVAQAAAEQERLEKAQKARQEYMDEFVGDAPVIYWQGPSGRRFENKPARIMYKD